MSSFGAYMSGDMSRGTEENLKESSFDQFVKARKHDDGGDNEIVITG